MTHHLSDETFFGDFPSTPSDLPFDPDRSRPTTDGGRLSSAAAAGAAGATTASYPYFSTYPAARSWTPPGSASTMGAKTTATYASMTEATNGYFFDTPASTFHQEMDSFSPGYIESPMRTTDSPLSGYDGMFRSHSGDPFPRMVPSSDHRFPDGNVKSEMPTVVTVGVSPFMPPDTGQRTAAGPTHHHLSPFLGPAKNLYKAGLRGVGPPTAHATHVDRIQPIIQPTDTTVTRTKATWNSSLESTDSSSGTFASGIRTMPRPMILPSHSSGSESEYFDDESVVTTDTTTPADRTSVSPPVYPAPVMVPKPGAPLFSKQRSTTPTALNSSNSDASVDGHSLIRPPPASSPDSNSDCDDTTLMGGRKDKDEKEEVSKSKDDTMPVARVNNDDDAPAPAPAPPRRRFPTRGEDDTQDGSGSSSSSLYSGSYLKKRSPYYRNSNGSNNGSGPNGSHSRGYSSNSFFYRGHHNDYYYNSGSASTTTKSGSKSTDDDGYGIKPGDEILFEGERGSVLSIDLSKDPPTLKARMRRTNEISTLPMDEVQMSYKLTSLASGLTRTPSSSLVRPQPTMITTMTEVSTLHRVGPSEKSMRKNHFQRLNDETLMKLPHLRKHKDYIKSLDVSSGPRDYNSFRETLDDSTTISTLSSLKSLSSKSITDQGISSKSLLSTSSTSIPSASDLSRYRSAASASSTLSRLDSLLSLDPMSDGEEEETESDADGTDKVLSLLDENNSNNTMTDIKRDFVDEKSKDQSNTDITVDGSDGSEVSEVLKKPGRVHRGRSLDELLESRMAARSMTKLRPVSESRMLRGSSLGGGLSGGMRRGGYTTEKGDLFKTELCENWVTKGQCSYGKKCHFAHGGDDLKYRVRVANYKTQPCCDPAREDTRLCLFGKRCNYAHPGEPLRRAMEYEYRDRKYYDIIAHHYGGDPHPFGIYI